MKRLFKLQITKEFSKFAVVGVINTVIHMVFLFIFTAFFSIWYMLSSFFAFLIAVSNSFIMNTVWTFKKDIKHKTATRYGKFFIVSIIAAVSNLFFLYVFTEFAGLWYMLSQLIAIVLTLMINFVGNKLWTYNTYE